MKRRKLIQLTTTTLLTTLATGLTSQWQNSLAQSTPENTLTVQWLGHTSFLFTGGGLRILVNPFRQIGCTAGYRSPQEFFADLILISSRLLDEGVTEGFAGNPALLYEPGVYQFNGNQIQGIRTLKDRFNGRQFGVNVAWLWKQAGIKILHLGGLSGPLGMEERILIGRPDLMLIPVGGGEKSYTPEEAKKTIEFLNPKIVIPTHYRTLAADVTACDIEPVDNFLSVMAGTSIQIQQTDTLTLTADNLPKQGPIINVLNYNFDVTPKS
ncbi:MAG: MBL fold metallo-hydrolase [Planktothrix sp. GU0601_MAG3]|nr:MAG: MBL fold metallo-hydrolase [Planktothrix sp. GU0601_MAG3]